MLLSVCVSVSEYCDSYWTVSGTVLLLYSNLSVLLYYYSYCRCSCIVILTASVTVLLLLLSVFLYDYT